MDRVPSILMVTWNRREYLERTLAHLLADPADFRLYFWDNGSADGAADLIAGLGDERVAVRHFNGTNVGQFAAWHWFLGQAKGDIGGKLDDDILGPARWSARLADMLVAEERLGVLGSWVYLESDWEEAAAAHKIVEVGSYRIFRNAWVAGCIFLGRLDRLRRYSSTDPQRLGVPLLQADMSRDGLVNGYPLPIPFAENLDDPRSPHCRMNRPGGWDEFAAYTARMRNFAGPEEYGRWIAADARTVLETPLSVQLRQAFPTAADRARAKLTRGLAKLAGR